MVISYIDFNDQCEVILAICFRYTPLLVAAMSGNTSAIKMLLERGAQINHIDKDKHSAVHWAVVCGQV